MQIRFANSPGETRAMNTQTLRDNYLIDNLFTADAINLTYSHYDRMIVGGAHPIKETITLQNPEELKANFF